MKDEETGLVTPLSCNLTTYGELYQSKPAEPHFFSTDSHRLVVSSYALLQVYALGRSMQTRSN